MVFLWTVLLGAGLNAGALENVLPWREPDAPFRAVFEAFERLPEMYLELPARIESHGKVTRLSAWSADQALSITVAHVDEKSIHALVRGLVELPRDASFVVYLFAAPEGEGISPDADIPKISRTVAATVVRAAGRDAPPSWEAMQHVWLRRGGREHRYFLEEFAPFSGKGQEGWFPKKGGPRNFLARLTARFLLREPLRFRPALKAPTRAYARLGRTPVVSTPAGEGWAVGEARTLPAGVHEVEVYQWCHETIDVRLATAEGENGTGTPLEEVSWLPPNSPPVYRGERLRLPLQPDFEIWPAPSYGFEGAEDLFTPVRFVNKSVSWLDQEVEAEWFANGSRIGTGDEVSHVFVGEGVQKVELRVQDSLGYRAEIVRPLVISGPPSAEFRLDAWWRGLPPAAYFEDPLRPELWLTGACPDDFSFEVTVWYEEADLLENRQDDTVETRGISLKKGWGQVRLAPLTAGEARSFSWSVAHAGRVLLSGNVRFARPPFREAPREAVGDALFDGRGRVVYLPRRVAAESPVGRPPLAPKGLYWIDGSLAPENTSTPGEIAVVLNQLRLALGMKEEGRGGLDRLGWEELSGAGSGTSLAGTLAGLENLPVRDRAVLISVGREAWHAGEPPGMFERRLAAMTGLLRDALGAAPVLVTPPPYAPGDGLRPYAEAVYRVADAHALPVADLYSVIRGAENPGVFIGETRLTEAGIALAGRLIAECFE